MYNFLVVSQLNEPLSALTQIWPAVSNTQLGIVPWQPFSSKSLHLCFLVEPSPEADGLGLADGEASGEGDGLTEGEALGLGEEDGSGEALGSGEGAAVGEGDTSTVDEGSGDGVASSAAAVDTQANWPATIKLTNIPES